jgi:D-alanyl-D-alanine carboxypeptidase
MKLVKCCVLLLCLVSCNVLAESNLDSAKKAQIQATLDHWRSSTAIPSATLSILLPQQTHPITFTSGTAYKNSAEKDDALFQAGSITKSFTSTVILQLEAQKKLNINDPITKYLPQYPRWHNITIRELLNHTSGIFNYTETAAFNNIRKNKPQAVFTPGEIVQLASQHPDYFAPGQGWKYSNTNYVLAGMIIQKVMKQPVENVMNHYLHNGSKLNLAHTFYLARLYTHTFIAKMVHGYSMDGHDVTSDNMSWASTAGAIVTTPEDLITWWRNLFQNKILPARQMSEMMSLVSEGTSKTYKAGQAMPHLTDSEIGKGYGLGIIQSSYGSSKMGTVWWHNGSTKGYKAIVIWFPKNNIYMALTIDRDPGYLLKPDLPTIQHVLNILTA